MSDVYVNSWGRSNKLDDNYRYGCHNREPFVDTVVVQDGWDYSATHRQARVKTIPFVMLKECSYTTTELGRKDAGCTACKWRAE